MLNSTITCLIVVLLAYRGQVLSTGAPHTADVPRLAQVALVDPLHLHHAVVSNAMHLAVVVLPEALQMLALVLLDRLEKVSQLFCSR